MNIQPTKEHLEIIKEIGSKWVIGLATMHGALFALLVSNYGKEDNLWLNIAMLLSGVGIILSVCIGSNTCEMFLKYYAKPIYLKAEEDDIKLYNRKIDLFAYLSVLCLMLSGILFFFRNNTVNLRIALGILFLIILFFGIMIQLFHLFIFQKKSIGEGACALLALGVEIWIMYTLMFNVCHMNTQVNKYDLMFCGNF